MLTQKFGDSRYMTSKALTAAIVGSVVLVNSVAWGIPLLVGEDHRPSTPPVLDGSRLKTGTVPRPERPTKVRPRRVTKIALKKLDPPLPRPAPRVAANRLDFVNASLRPAPVGGERAVSPLLKSEPATLFPRPRRASINLVQPPRSAEPVHDNSDKSRAKPLGIRTSSKRAVSVSPFTPGAKISPNQAVRPLYHDNSASKPTTLDTAKAIARRAALRFEQMRDRMAKLDARDAVLSHQEQARRRALLPVAPRPARAADQGTVRTVAKSAVSYIRPRLVRRPLGRAAQKRYVPPVSRTAGTILLDDGRTNKLERATPQRIASVSRDIVEAPAQVSVTRSAKPSRLTRIKRRAGSKRSLRSARRRQARLTSRARSRRSASRQRKINGFRRDFHRQLVSANFFGNPNP